MSNRKSVTAVVNILVPVVALAFALTGPLTRPCAAQDDYGTAPARTGWSWESSQTTKPAAKPRRLRTTRASVAPQPGVQPLAPPAHPKDLDPAPGGVSDVGPLPAVIDPGPLALVGGTVHTVSGETHDRATILIQNGEITAVGSSVPDGVRRVDVSGYHVYPSLIAADTVMGLVEINAVRSTRDQREVGEINPNVSAEVAINPSSTLIPVTRSNGILVVMTAPRGGLISGTGAVIELDGWTAEDMTLEAPVALLVNWPRMRLNHAPDARTPLDKQKQQRDAKIEMLREAFETARAYARGRDAVRAGDAPPLDRDVKWDAMVAAVRGDLPVLISASTILEIKAALDFAKSQGLTVILKSGGDVLRVKERLRDEKIPVMISSVLRVGRRWDPYDSNFTLPLKLHEAGVEFCLTSGDNGFSVAHTRSLPYAAAKAVAYGLPPEIALKALTLYPAEILGVADRLGSIERGKDATLIVTDGDPLDIRTNVHRAFIRGREVDLTDRHKRLYERYRMRPRNRVVR